MSKKKVKIDPLANRIDFDSEYWMYMTRKEIKSHKLIYADWVKTKIELCSDGTSIRAFAPGYRDSYFINPYYFLWLKDHEKFIKKDGDSDISEKTIYFDKKEDY